MTFNDALSSSTGFTFLAKTGLCCALGRSVLPYTHVVFQHLSYGIILVGLVALGGSLGVHFGSIWLILGRLGLILVHLGSSWAHLGSSWLILVSSWDALGSSELTLGSLLVHLGSSWVHVGSCWLILEAPWVKIHEKQSQLI